MTHYASLRVLHFWQQTMSKRMKKIFRITRLLGLCTCAAAASLPSLPAQAQAQAPDGLQRGFVEPPVSTKPRCYWYWMDGRVSKQGITRDMEAMRRVGIGTAYIGIIAGQAGAVDSPSVQALSEPWWQLVEHAVREGGRLGVDLGLFNSPGWSQSGGPWVQPSQAMRHVVLSEIRVRGPQRFEGALPAPEGALQDIGALAFRAPSGDSDTIGAHNPSITSEPSLANAASLFDGDAAAGLALPSGAQITMQVAEPFTARSLTIQPSQQMRAGCELQASDDGRVFRSVRRFDIDRHNTALNVGPVPLAPVCIAFPEVSARFFRLVFSGPGELSEVSLSASARLESYQEKQLSKVFQDPQPPFDAYVWPAQAEPENARLAVDKSSVRDLSPQLSGGTLRWDVPLGEWIVQRFAMASTGVTNSPAPREGTGLEIDKMSRQAVRAHFDAYVGQLLKRMPAWDRRSLKYLVADSYETGPQNWTDSFAPDFKSRYGYDARPFLPTLSGRIVGSAEQSNRFLWDLRRLVADRVAHDYVGGLTEVANRNGLRTWLENYGHWGFPGEFLQYGSGSDEIGGEFWADGNLGSIELRDASSAAHIYGKPVTYAEAFTGGPLFSSTPWSLKKRGDWAFCEGINQFVLHVSIAQPDERRPGISAPFGTEFNRHNTWFEQSQSWIKYLRRCQFLLQQGKYVADVAYFIGEDAPKMTGARQPELPPGYSFDYINADAIEKRLQVRNGRLALPDGMSYRLLVLPDGASIRPALLRKLRALVAEGGAILGNPPTQSPSLEDYPRADQQVRQIAAQMWAKPSGTRATSSAFGRGLVFRGASLQNALSQLGTPPDFSGVDSRSTLFIHRSTPQAEVYFLSNQTDGEQAISPAFRVQGRAPELWHPDSGQVQPLAVYQSEGGLTRVPLRLAPRGSVFVVFRGKASRHRIVRVLRDGKAVLDTAPQPVEPNAPASKYLSMALWVKPSEETVLLPEARAGIIGLSERRNDVIFPPHGETFSREGRHAGVGLSVGTNGVSVFEHGASYFVPILTYASPINAWTHLAIVYNDGQPSLYVNGVLAHTGLHSDYTVHLGTPGDQFRGTIGGFEQYSRALSPTEIASLARTTPPTATPRGAPVEITLDGQGRLQALVWQPGRYTLQSAEGRARVVAVPTLPAESVLGGSWQVSFAPSSGAPAQASFDKLESWTQHSDPTIKYHSGTAAYRKSFSLSAGALSPKRRLYLDLGDVQSLAQVILNGRSLGTLWKAPYRLDISGSARAGANQLEVRVTNAWHNRMVGQKRQPEAFAAPGVEQPWASVIPDYGPNEPLFPSGLLGPVTLRQAELVPVP